jgi:hypothetical protein
MFRNYIFVPPGYSSVDGAERVDGIRGSPSGLGKGMTGYVVSGREGDYLGKRVEGDWKTSRPLARLGKRERRFGR